MHLALIQEESLKRGRVFSKNMELLLRVVIKAVF